MKTKTFDAVEMKRKAAQRIHEEIKDLSVEEETEYWQRKYEKLLRLKEQAIRERGRRRT